MFGSGVLALPWSVAQLGWTAGPLALIGFSFITYYTSTLLADTYRAPDPVTGSRNPTYTEAVRAYLSTSFIINLYASLHLKRGILLSWTKFQKHCLFSNINQGLLVTNSVMKNIIQLEIPNVALKNRIMLEIISDGQIYFDLINWQNNFINFVIIVDN